MRDKKRQSSYNNKQRRLTSTCALELTGCSNNLTKSNFPLKRKNAFYTELALHKRNRESSIKT